MNIFLWQIIGESHFSPSIIRWFFAITKGEFPSGKLWATTGWKWSYKNWEVKMNVFQKYVFHLAMENEWVANLRYKSVMQMIAYLWRIFCSHIWWSERTSVHPPSTWVILGPNVESTVPSPPPVIFLGLPSGKHTKNYGKIHHV